MKETLSQEQQIREAQPQEKQLQEPQNQERRRRDRSVPLDRKRQLSVLRRGAVVFLLGATLIGSFAYSSSSSRQKSFFIDDTTDIAERSPFESGVARLERARGGSQSTHAPLLTFAASKIEHHQSGQTEFFDIVVDSYASPTEPPYRMEAPRAVLDDSGWRFGDRVVISQKSSSSSESFAKFLEGGVGMFSPSSGEFRVEGQPGARGYAWGYVENAYFSGQLISWRRQGSTAEPSNAELSTPKPSPQGDGFSVSLAGMARLVLGEPAQSGHARLLAVGEHPLDSNQVLLESSDSIEWNSAERSLRTIGATRLRYRDVMLDAGAVEARHGDEVSDINYVFATAGVVMFSAAGTIEAPSAEVFPQQQRIVFAEPPIRLTNQDMEIQVAGALRYRQSDGFIAAEQAALALIEEQIDIESGQLELYLSAREGRFEDGVVMRYRDPPSRFLSSQRADWSGDIVRLCGEAIIVQEADTISGECIIADMVRSIVRVEGESVRGLFETQ